MSHPNRNWRRRWTVDLAARTATHADGWVFEFDAASDADGGIDGRCTSHPSLIGYDTRKLPQTAARIAREAGDIYIEARREQK